jgi:hypothetical protein
MQYIDSIRLEAEKAGVIKIIPPKEWACPFSVCPQSLDVMAVLIMLQNTQKSLCKAE